MNAAIVVRLVFTAILGLTWFTGSTGLAEPQSASSPRWPLRVSGNGRHLADQDGRPFFFMCDTAWGLMSNTSTAEMKVYIDDRANRKFTAVHVNGLRGLPITKATIVNRPQARFDRIKTYADYARGKGMAFQVVLAWMGSGGRDWAQVFRTMSQSEVKGYARWAGNQLRGYPNIIYSLGGDIEPTSDDIRVADWMAAGLAETDPDKPVTFFSNPKDSSSFWFHDRAWLDFNFIEVKAVDGAQQYTRVISDYHKSPTKPTHLGEFAYEYEYTGQRWPKVEAHPMRRSAYLTVLSGAMGVTYGRRGLWHFNDTEDRYRIYKPWQDLLTCAKSPGGCAMARMVELMERVGWHKLVPSHADTFATSGVNQGSIDFTASAVTSDGKWAVAYFPKSKSTTFNLNKLDAGDEVKAQWFDPHSGAYQAVPGSPFPRGSRSFSPPGNNSDGDPDWVLVLESVSSGSPPPPPTTIDSPSAGTVFSPGQTVTATGSGANLSWSVDRITDGAGPFATGAGSSITFTVPADSTSQQVIEVTLTGDGGTATRTYSIADTPAGSGSGLTGEYYDTMDFSGTPLFRTDPEVNFDWGQGSPDGSIGPDTFSVRWTGQVEPAHSEVYTFFVRTDDGVRLWVDGQLLIDAWVDQSATEWSQSIALSAGGKVDLRMEYYENGGNAAAELRWSSASTPKGAIPADRLHIKDSDGDGISDAEEAASGQGSGSGSPAGSTGRGGCGLTGTEVFLFLGLLSRIRRRKGAGKAYRNS